MPLKCQAFKSPQNFHQCNLGSRMFPLFFFRLLNTVLSADKLSSVRHSHFLEPVRGTVEPHTKWSHVDKITLCQREAWLYCHSCKMPLRGLEGVFWHLKSGIWGQYAAIRRSFLIGWENNRTNYRTMDPSHENNTAAWYPGPMKLGFLMSCVVSVKSRALHLGAKFSRDCWRDNRLG